MDNRRTFSNKSAIQLQSDRLKTNGFEPSWGNRTYIMGIINATPDSFSGDGLYSDQESALSRSILLQSHGADIIDVGGESTRPGATYVEAEEEIRRTVPIIELLSANLSVPISIDTYKPEVAKEAIKAGASIINDVWGLRYDTEMANLAAQHDIPLILMHNQHGTHYSEMIMEVKERLKESADLAIRSGVDPKNIILDPGVGFGKTARQNLAIIRHLGQIKDIGYPILIGTSRKSMIGAVLNIPEDRLAGTAATVALAIANGVDMVRVHDVKEMKRVAQISDSIARSQERHISTTP
jgi:dihydropteroate synthase